MDDSSSALPCPEAADLPGGVKSSVDAVSGRRGGASESSDDYPSIVAVLDEKTRVIECSARIQWIIQRRIRNGRHPWQSQYFCRTKEGLLRYAPKPIPPELLTLPDFIT
jgi:hypothetical protein